MAGAENDNFDTYKLLFENWRFQVQNNWQRSSYFAVFGDGGACWCMECD